MNRTRLVPGILLIALGVLFLLDRLDLAAAGPLLARWWPLVIVGLGALRLLDRPPDVLGGGVTAGIGLVLLTVTQGLLTAEVLAYAVPVGFIAVGAWIILGRGARPLDAGVDAVQAVAVFSGRELSPSSSRFRGGSLLAVFGGIELDLRHARLHPDGARLDLTCLFGGFDLVVPPGWLVEMQGPAVFGGYENHAQGQVLPEGAPRLDIRVLTVFGGAEVKVQAPLATWPAVTREGADRPLDSR